MPVNNPKGALIERLQKAGRGQPEFNTEQSGPDHEPVFTSEVVVDGETWGEGRGGSKKDAERRAAEEALEALERGGRRAARNGRAGGRDPERGASEPQTPAPVAAPGAGDEPFTGPWPVFEDVLEACLRIAHERADRKLAGDEAVEAVRDLALALYKGVLGNLGEVVEVEDEDA